MDGLKRELLRASCGFRVDGGCGKRAFRARRDAKAALKLARSRPNYTPKPGRKLSVYACASCGGLFHLGHSLPAIESEANR